MNAEQMALVAAIAQDIENISMRLQELVRQTLIAAEEKTDWRPLRLPPCLSESPSPVLELSESPTSVVSTPVSPELVVSEVCCTGAACVHRCTVCLADLTLRDEEGFCWTCVEELKTVPADYPEDAADATRNSLYGQGAFHALLLRIRANNCREAADDTDDAEEVRNCLKEAKRLDGVASDLLFKGADSTFKPWWFYSWDYWMQPGSAYNGDKNWKAKPKRPDYNHANWPSPRAKQLANTILKPKGKKIRKHEDALQFLADRAKITVTQLLTMSSGEYRQKYR